MIRDPETLELLLATRAPLRPRATDPERAAGRRRRRDPAEIAGRDARARPVRPVAARGLRRPRADDGGGGARSPSSSRATSPAFRSLFGTNNGIGAQGIVIDGTEAQKAALAAAPRARRDRSASFALTEPGIGLGRGVACHHARGATATHYVLERHQALHHQRAGGRHLHGDGAHRPDSDGRRRHLGVHRRARHARAVDRQARPQDGPARRAHRRRDLRRLPRARRRT